MEANRPPNTARRALLVCGAFAPEPCGVGDYTSRLAAHLAEQGCEVHVLTSTRAEPQPGIHVHARVVDWKANEDVRAVLDEVMGGIRPNVVQIQYPGSYGAANRALAGNLLPKWVRATGVRVCTTLHEWGERKLQWKLRAGFMALSSDALVAVTSHDAHILRRVPLVGRRVVRHIPIGANLEFDRLPAQRGDVPVLGYFGFLHPLKGVSELVDAAALLRDRGVAYRLDLHGHFHPDRDSHHASIRAQVDAARLGDHVRFPGPVPADAAGAAEAFRETTIGVLPFREGVSERRGSFLALGQAGFPILTSPGIWQPEWLRDGANVFLERLEPSAWADRIEHLLSNRDALPPVGTRLRSEIVNRHSWSAIAREHVQLWGTLA